MRVTHRLGVRALEDKGMRSDNYGDSVTVFAEIDEENLSRID